MQAYPAYTIKTIEDTLSWRQVDGLIAQWDGHMPTNRIVFRIEQILEHAHGVSFGTPGAEEKKDQSIINAIEEFGWSM